MLVAIIDNEELIALIEEHNRILKEERGPTSAFWFSFLEMMNVLFAYTRATKLGNWDLHLETTLKMIPWFFAYDRQNYSRYASYYWAEMVQLHKTHPNIHKEFM